jgi:toxin ParE1/3/4
MRDIIWSGPALGDLRRISAWLMENADPDTAVWILAAIRSACNTLENFPSRSPLLAQDHRKLRVKGTRYLIIYRISEAGIFVTRVFHAREDWQLGE